ncbi:MAG: hypothetical protein ACRC6E_09225 [Fusobacteriaceae bacterium]
MKKEMLMELKKDYNVGEKVCFGSKNYTWIVEKGETGWNLKITEHDGSDSNLGHLEGKYETIDLVEKAIHEKVTSYDFITYNGGIKKQRNDFIGKKWGELSLEEQNFLLETSYVDNDNLDKKTGECIVDFENGLSVSGKVVSSGSEEDLEIEEKAEIYDPSL